MYQWRDRGIGQLTTKKLQVRVLRIYTSVRVGMWDRLVKCPNLAANQCLAEMKHERDLRTTGVIRLQEALESMSREFVTELMYPLLSIS